MSLDTPTPERPWPVVLYEPSGSVLVSHEEDTPHVSGDAGVMLLGVRNDSSATAFTGANGDYSPVAVNNAGNLLVVGGVAHGGSQVTQALLAAAIGQDALSADVTNNFLTRLAAGRDGVLYTRIRPKASWSVTHAPAAAAQATISQTSAGAGLKNVMRGFMVTVIASGATTAEPVIINIRDGATGAGTVLWSAAIEVPTLSGAGSVSGSPFGMSDIYFVGSAATAMTIETAAAPGANIAVRVNAWGEVTA